MFLDIIASVMRGFNSVAQDKVEIDEYGSGDDYEDASGSGESTIADDIEESSGVEYDYEEEDGKLFDQHLTKIFIAFYLNRRSAGVYY